MMGNKSLLYGLRPGVTIAMEKDAVVLILAYPLKVIRLKVYWAPMLDLMSRSDLVSFDQIFSTVNEQGPNQVELFLNDLVRRGFFRKEGRGLLLENPPVTVVVPVRNRPDDIRLCLKSLMKVEYPSDKFEVIVVDDASSDLTGSQVLSFSARLITMKEQQGPAKCRNIGAREARGDIIAFLDSDCTVGPAWLQELLPGFNNPDVAGVGGWVDSYYEDKALDLYEKVKSSLFLGSWPKASSKEDRFFYVPSCNLLVRKNAFLGIGGFVCSLSVGEDVDLCWRLQNAGYTIEYLPSGRVYHKHRNRLKTFCLRRFDYGTSEPILQKIHKDRKKRMVLPTGAVMFWGLIIFALIFHYPFLPVAGAVVLAFEGRSKYIKVKGSTDKLKRLNILFAVGRSYGAFLYHVCTFVSRYYLLLSFVICPWDLFAATTIWAAHACVGLMEHVNKGPRLNPVSFLWFFTLDQVSYQIGVWWACLKTRNFNPINPQLVLEAK